MADNRLAILMKKKLAKRPAGSKEYGTGHYEATAKKKKHKKH